MEKWVYELLQLSTECLPQIVLKRHASRINDLVLMCHTMLFFITPAQNYPTDVGSLKH